MVCALTRTLLVALRHSIIAAHESAAGREPMLGRFFQRAPRGILSPHCYFKSRPAIQHVAPSFKPTRSFWISSNLNQRYRHYRFYDPSPHPSNGSSYFQSFWYRLSPAQRFLLVGFGGGAPIFYVTHLETVEPTGRRRFIFMSRAMEEQLGGMVTHGIEPR